MVDVNLSEQDITVLAGPSRIDLQVGLGQQGQRGSRIFAGEDSPALFFSPAVTEALGLELYDLYVNVNSSDPEYLYLYQFIGSDGGTVWEAITRLVPNQINISEALTFTAGSATLSVLLTDYYPLSLISEISTSPITVTANIHGPNPAAISIVSKSVTAQTLTVVFRAAQLDGTWSLLSGLHTINTSINFVPVISQIS